MRQVSLLSFIIAAFVLQPHMVLADEHRWHDSDIHHFHEHDYEHWRGGSWYHGDHDGRDGWWWTIDNSFYYYPAPVYPYPDPYTPPTVNAASMAPAPLTAPPAYAYYCPRPAGYYPYVANCFRPWRRVVMSQAKVIEPAPIINQSVSQSVPQGISQRDADDRHLNALAVALQNIDLNSPNAAKSLRKLSHQVENFHQTLFQRSYNAMDILKDTEDLQKRIAAARSQRPDPISTPPQ